jgi:DNA-binding NtrC family response regulator
MVEAQRQLYVFVVDDEDVIATTLAVILRLQGGFRARAFSRPFAALAAARQEAPDLLISDVGMPGLSGIDLAIQIQNSCPDCKVVLFSGQASTAYRIEAARANGYDFELLFKPVDPKDLLARIQSLMEVV